MATCRVGDASSPEPFQLHKGRVMRILLAVHHFPPRYTGGAEWRAHRTARALIERGHTVRVICVERVDEAGAHPLKWEDGLYDGVPVRRLSFNLASSPDLFRWSYDNTWIGDHLREVIADFKPDVLHLISGYLVSGRALLVAAELRVPSIVTLTDFWFLCPRLSLLKSDGHISSLPTRPEACAQCLGEERRRYRWLGRLLPGPMRQYWSRQSAAIHRIEDRSRFLLEALNTARVIISPSNFLRKLHIDAGVAPGRIRFSRQGRDFPQLTPEKLVKSPSDHLRIGYIGQVAELKGVHVILEAAQQLPNAKLTVSVFGDLEPYPRYAARLQALAAHDPRVTLAGPYHGHDQLARVFSDLDVIVVPSLWYENSPNAILEAFAHKTPVLATRLGGMAELVDHDVNGLLFTAGDARDLATQLQRLIDEPELLGRLRQGIPPVRGQGSEIDELESIYHESVASPLPELATHTGRS